MYIYCRSGKYLKVKIKNCVLILVQCCSDQWSIVMATNTIYVSGGDQDEELETEIVEIYTAGPNKSGRFNLT